MISEWIVSACILILVVLALRAGLGGKISARLRYALWAVVLVRLLVPASISLEVTVPKLPKWNPPEVLREESIYVLPVDSRPVDESGVFWTEDGIAMDPYSVGYPRLTGDGERVVRYVDKISPLELLKGIWLAGGAVLGVVLLVSNLRFGLRLRRSRRRLEGAEGPLPVYVSAGLPSPCLFGLPRPAVYVTEDAAADPVMLRHVLAHELTHYRHLDHLWSVLRGVALAVHWWNPLVWLAVVLSRRDGELACDEGALERLGDGARTAYGETLLALVTARARPQDLLSFATTMTGGKRSLTERIHRIACQPKQLVSAVVAIATVLTLTVLCTFGKASGDLIDPDSATGFTAFSASTHSVSQIGTLVYTPDDLQKDLSAPDNPIDVPLEAGKELVQLINTHRKSVYGQGDLTLNGIEHHFTKIDCTDGGFYLVDYWYWNGFSLLHGEDSFTTLMTRFDADGNAGTTWQMEHSFDRDYKEWRTAYADVLWSPDAWRTEVLSSLRDLDRDGSPETVRVLHKMGESSEEWRLEIFRESEDGAVEDELWSKTLDDSRGNCGAYFLYQSDGLDYLLSYMPRMQQGQCTYSYRLFHLEDGEEVTDRENSVEFDINFDAPSHRFLPEEIAAFMWEVNGLIGDSQLLLNTNVLSLEDGEDGRLRDNILISLNYQGILDFGSEDDLLASLRVYVSHAADHPDDINSPLGDLLAEIEAADIGDISGQNQVTAADLAVLLREIASNRASRYHTFENYFQEEAWMWSTAEWAVPVADGGTLYLLSCDSGNVEIAYETEDSSTSAFYDDAQALYDLIARVGEPYYLEELPYNVNLNRDRSPDKLTLRSDKPSGGYLWCLQWEDNGDVWRGEASTSHPGWTAFFLCRMDGEDYLLEYTPYIGMGMGSYRYRLFYLEEGGEVVVQENDVFFDMNFGMEGERDFDPKAIAAFMEEINGLLAHSTLLLCTDPDLAATFEREGRLYDSLWWLDADFEREADKSLLENLLIYRNQALVDASAPDISSLLSEIQEDAIQTGDVRVISWNSQPPAKELADSLHRIAGALDWSGRGGEEALYRAGLVRPNGANPPDIVLLEALGTKGLLRVTCQRTETILQYSENPDNDSHYLHDQEYTVTAYAEDETLYRLLCEQGTPAPAVPAGAELETYQGNGFTVYMPAGLYRVQSQRNGDLVITAKQDARAGIKIFSTELTSQQICETPGLLFDGVSETAEIPTGEGSRYTAFSFSDTVNGYSCRKDVWLAEQGKGCLAVVCTLPDNVDISIERQIQNIATSLEFAYN